MLLAPVEEVRVRQALGGGVDFFDDCVAGGGPTMEPSTLPYMPLKQRAGAACVFRTGKFSLMR